MSSPLVGIIANPASGRDIRRLVAHGTVFDNNEKTAIVRRVLLGLEAVGVRRVAYMPEHDFGILPRALSELQSASLQLSAAPLPMPVSGTSIDSTHAAQLLVELGACCIVTLGGDGTNRAVSLGCASVPLVPISTGTNNVFPTFLEGTIAGMAAGLVAHGITNERTVRQVPRLEVCINDVAVESALVDVVVSSQPFVGARALWDMSVVREVVLSRVVPATIGLSALGGALLNSTDERNGPSGMHIVLGAGDNQAYQVLAPLAPGLISWVGVKEYRSLAVGDVVRFQSGIGTIALDGERELELSTSMVAEVRLAADGPYVVNVSAALEAAAHAGCLHRSM
ncbi:MAG TPA: NAD(+)/NADH kinase [Ktedonobacteraceae bacterium]|nr:NAD(+)/NADH kinase [Ktedonobacteraceae bacterium]